MTVAESEKVRNERKERILKSRYVFRNKNAGLVDEKGVSLPLRAKARLCVAGQNCPDCMSGEVRVDAPTVQHSSLTTFLHLVASLGWIEHWRSGDISSAFFREKSQKVNPSTCIPLLLDFREWIKGKSFALSDLFMVDRMHPGLGMNKFPLSLSIRWALKEVSLIRRCSFIGKVMGNPMACWFCMWMILWLLLMVIVWLNKRLNCCVIGFLLASGKMFVKMLVVSIIAVKKLLRQRGFVDGRLELVPLNYTRKKQLDEPVTEEEKSDFRSVVGALQWLTTQTRPDLAFVVNQLQKRINKLTVRDLLEANKAVRIAKQNEIGLKFRNLGKDVAVVTWHDAGLFNSVGVELDEADGDYIHELGEKKMLYSQKGAVTGFVKCSDLDRTDGVSCNFTSWCSKTNRRIVESSFAAETHGAIVGFGQGQYQRMLLLEIMHGSWVVQRDDLELNRLVPLVLCTDCKSVFELHTKRCSKCF